jgi:hypothetical protein
LISTTTDVAYGAPIEGLVHFPSLGFSLGIRFLIDTGAALSAISRDDIDSLGPESVAALPLERHSTPLSGAGGALDSSVLRVGIGFIHDEAEITFVSLPVAVLQTPNMPSLLGRDVLSMGRLHIDGPAGTAQLDLPPGTFRLPDRL